MCEWADTSGGNICCNRGVCVRSGNINICCNMVLVVSGGVGVGGVGGVGDGSGGGGVGDG